MTGNRIIENPPHDPAGTKKNTTAPSGPGPKTHGMKLRAKISAIVSGILVLTFGTTFYRTSRFQDELVIAQAERQARMMAQQILLTREWVASHDGLFVAKKPGVDSNPFLPEGEIQDLQGRHYVKRNPAMVTRELSEYADQIDLCRFRVTSLKPVNPANRPNSFEQRGLLLFENSEKKEILEVAATPEGRAIRYMLPLEVEESCLECHGVHGYKIGDIRGALSLEIPIAWADKIIAANNRMLILIASLTIFLTGLAMFLTIDHIVVRRLRQLSKVMSDFPGREINPEDLPGGPDEIGRLSDNFANLGDRLTAYQGELLKNREKMFENEKMASIGHLTAGIAHEINNPLGGMRNCLKSMREKPDDQELRQRYLDLLDQGLQRIGHTVRQLLNFGRKDPLRYRDIEIDDLIRDCFGLLKYKLEDIDLALDLNIDHSQRVDVEALKQVLVNIGLNAIHAMPKGGSLKVTSSETEDHIVIAITDSGHGIPPEDIPRIFDPFFTTKGIGEGTGLGLAVSISLIKKMAGDITVESLKDWGSTFRIEIPKKPPETSVTQHEAEDSLPLSGKHGHG